MAKFKQEVLEKIKSDADLYAEVAKVMGVKPTSLATIVDRNGSTLNQYKVVKAVADYLSVSDPEELLEENSSEESAPQDKAVA